MLTLGLEIVDFNNFFQFFNLNLEIILCLFCQDTTCVCLWYTAVLRVLEA